MQRSWRWLGVTAFAPVVWGSTYYVTQRALPADAPLWGATFRALPAAVVLLLLVRRLPRGSWWWQSLVLGMLNVGAFFVLLYVAAQTLPSSVASSIMAASPVAMMLVAWALISERPTARAALGAALGIGGVALIVATGAVAVNPWGVAASVTAMLMSSVGFVLAKRWSGQVPILDATAWQLAWAGAGLAVVAFVAKGPPPAYGPTAWLAFAYVSLVATALAYVAWFTGLAHLPAGTVGIVGLLNPVSGVMIGVLLGHERLSLTQALGIALVLGGIGFAGAAARPRVPRASGRVSVGGAVTTAPVSDDRTPPAPRSSRRGEST